MSIVVSEQFLVKLCGNPFRISTILNKIDPENADLVYPRNCVDGYHFEDVTLTVGMDERGAISLLGATSSNVRGSLEVVSSSLGTVANILQTMAAGSKSSGEGSVLRGGIG